MVPSTLRHQQQLVARTGIQEFAALAVELTARGGDEHARVVALGQPCVQLAQDPVGTRRASGDRAEEPGHPRHQERGGHTLVGHISDGEHQPVVIEQEEIVEVAPDLAGRPQRVAAIA